MKAHNIVSELLNEMGIADIVYVTDKISDKNDTVADARSAAFMAMGISIKKRTHCALIVPGEYITNILTAVTEAWFQKANLLVVGVFDNLQDLRIAWMDRYLVNRLDIRLEDLNSRKDKIREVIEEQGPKLLSVVCPPSKDEYHNYGSVYNLLVEKAENGQKLTVFDANPNDIISKKASITIIDKRYKYGMISKYIGASMLSSAGVLLCSSECLLVDINVLRTKYKKPWMKIIIHDPADLVKKKAIDKWIINNEWKYYESVFFKEHELSKFLADKEASIFVVR